MSYLYDQHNHDFSFCEIRFPYKLSIYRWELITFYLENYRHIHPELHDTCGTQPDKGKRTNEVFIYNGHL